jgi:hypothetical protein
LPNVGSKTNESAYNRYDASSEDICTWNDNEICIAKRYDSSPGLARSACHQRENLSHKTYKKGNLCQGFLPFYHVDWGEWGHRKGRNNAYDNETTLVDEYNSLPKLAPILFCGQPFGVLVGAYALEN